MFRFIIALFWSCSVLSAHHDDNANHQYNKERYKDILNNSFNERFLTIFFHPAANHGGYLFTEEEKAEQIWADEQGAKAFPVLLEILKREPTPGDGPGYSKEWQSVIIKQNILYWIKNYPEGDMKPFVEELRRQLPEWSKRQIANYDTHTGYIRQALDLLASEGDASDIPLVESFLNDLNPNNKHNAKKSLTKLKERLASDAPQKIRQRTSEAHSQQEASNIPSQEDEENGVITKTYKRNHYNGPRIIAGLFLLLFLALLLRAIILK